MFKHRDWTTPVLKGTRIVIQYFALLILIMLFIPACGIERRVVFVPLPYPQGEWSPERIPFAFDDVTFTSTSGNKLNAWLVKPTSHLVPALSGSSSGTVSQPDYYILYFHGNGGNLTYHVQYLDYLQRQLNAAVFCVDYSGYGRSEGKPTEEVLYKDSESSLKQFCEQTGLKPGQIIVMGRSLGGAMATELALKQQEKGQPFKALVLESTFSSIPDMAKKLVPVLPANMLLTTKFDTFSRLKSYSGPLYITHGDADRVVPYAQALRNVEAAKSVTNRNGRMEFYTIPDMDHNDPLSSDYFVRMKDFLNNSTVLNNSTGG